MSESISNITFKEDLEILRQKATDRSPAKLRNRQVNNNSAELHGVRNSSVRGKQQSPGRVRFGSEMSNCGSAFGSTGRTPERVFERFSGYDSRWSGEDDGEDLTILPLM
ncbi:hypothetical protein R6Q59_013781 [Mikania micrantha]